MSRLTDQNYLRSQQYHNTANLNARVNLHDRYSTNPYGWFRWVFDQYNLPQHCRVVELGCGSGAIWNSNATRIPENAEITLSDFSPGMVSQARQNLGDLRPFDFCVIDAQSIPFETAQFDVVIANHMLYHVPDRSRALREIRRVLNPDGRFYATTIGEKHMQELFELPERFNPGQSVDLLKSSGEFSLENGAVQLGAVFEHVSISRYPDSLHVTAAEPLVDYILSTVRFGGREQSREKFLRFVEEEMARRGGVMDITKDSGMFIAR